MYLLETETHTLHEFFGSEIPKYAILSHRWGRPDEELSFQQVRDGRADPHKSGTRKMVEACRVARERYQLQYIWIDTCCINKESSAELSEAINSMFQWYKDSTLCLAYLNDVDARVASPREGSFEKSKWFTRAWTLQELLAPTEIIFFDQSWVLIGPKKTCLDLVVEVTAIPADALTDNNSLWKFNIVQKMQWAANRRATRIEDIAYSLMGIFDVNMPLLYGEGTKAFIRLQEEIIRSTETTEFLVWGLGIPTHNLLADKPSSFLDVDEKFACSLEKFACSLQKSESSQYRSFTWNNLGLQLTTPIFRYDIDLYTMVLYDGLAPQENWVMLLRRSSRSENLYYKVCNIVDPTLMASNHGNVSRTALTTILRGTSKQTVGLELGEDVPHHILSEPYSVTFESYHNVIIRLPAREIAGLGHRVQWQELSRSFRYRATSKATIFWEQLCLILKVGSIDYLLLIVFDFDWRMCLTIVPLRQGGRRTIEMALIFMQEVFENFAGEPTLSGYHHVEMERVETKRIGVVYLARALGDGPFTADLPREAAFRGPRIWLRVDRISRRSQWRCKIGASNRHSPNPHSLSFGDY